MRKEGEERMKKEGRRRRGMESGMEGVRRRIEGNRYTVA